MTGAPLPLVQGRISGADLMNQPQDGSRQTRSKNEANKQARLSRGAKPLHEKTETLVEQLVEPAVQESGLELVEVTYTKEGPDWYLRVFIDHPAGVTLDTCQALSNKLNPLLDDADLVEQAYFFEVSSPGLERPLKKEADFRRYQGNKVRVTTYAPLAGQKKFEGVLKGLEAGKVIVELKDGTVEIPFDQVASARLMIDF